MCAPAIFHCFYWAHVALAGCRVRYLSFIDPERGGFGEILPVVMIFPEGFSPREISSLKEIFRRILQAKTL